MRMGETVIDSFWRFLTVASTYHVSDCVAGQGKKFSWFLPFDAGELLFDRNSPTEPPDIIFSPKDDVTGFEPDVENISVLTDTGNY